MRQKESLFNRIVGVVSIATKTRCTCNNIWLDGLLIFLVGGTFKFLMQRTSRFNKSAQNLYGIAFYSHTYIWIHMHTKVIRLLLRKSKHILRHVATCDTIFLENDTTPIHVLTTFCQWVRHRYFLKPIKDVHYDLIIIKANIY